MVFQTKVILQSPVSFPKNLNNCGQMRQKFLKYFLKGAGVLFLVTGIAKIVAVSDSSAVLKTIDPVFHIQFRWLGFGVGCLEFVAAVLCLFRRASTLNLAVVAWLATNFLVYRTALALQGWQIPCRCLGSLTGSLPISTQAASTITAWLLSALVCGSYALLLWQWCDSPRRHNSRLTSA